MASIPEPPISLKSIQSHMKIAADIERRDPIVAYWIRLYCTESALKIDKDSAESKSFLSSIILWLEKFKQTNKDDERVTNQTVGQAHVENYVMNIFNMADTLDRNGEANKRTVAMFFMASMLFETMIVFGGLTDEIQQRAKYAKFKAAYIQKCLKSGQTPKPGPIENIDLDEPSDISTQKIADNPAPSNPDDNCILPTPSQSKNSPSKPLVLPETPDKETGSSSASKISGGNDWGSSPLSQTNHSSISSTKFHAINGAPLKVEDMVKSQKFCKFAMSALQYDDITTAVTNLEKALSLLKTGKNPD